MKKIQTKIAVIVLATIVIVATVMGVLSINVTQNSTKSAIVKAINESVELAIASTENTLGTYKAIVKEIASNSILSDDETSLSDKKTFLQSKAEEYLIKDTGLVDTKGTNLFTGKNVKNQDFFKHAVTGKVYVSTLYVSKDKKDMHFIISAPVMKNNQVKSIIYFAFDGKILTNIVKGIEIGKKGEAYILDKEGTTIAYKEMDAVWNQENAVNMAKKNPEDAYYQEVSKVEEKMIRGESGLRECNYEDESYFQGYAPIPNTDGWSMAVVIDKSLMMEPAKKGAMIQIATMILIIISGIFVARFIGGTLSKPIVNCANRLKLLAEGDLTSETPVVSSKDEVKILSDSTRELVENMNEMISDIRLRLNEISNGNLVFKDYDIEYLGDFLPLQTSMKQIILALNDTIRNIVASSQEVAVSSEQVAMGASALSQGASEQASSIEQLSSTMSEITNNINKTAVNSKSASELSSMADKDLIQGNQSMKELKDAMDEIHLKSNEISKIVKAIDDIAFQTNILALNAAVEAARAGTAGKGFAVVADEVRNLANKSAAAAKNTTQLIENCMAATRKGVDITNETAESLIRVMNSSKKANEYIMHISEDAKEQAKAVNEVNLSVDQIAKVIQNNSATSEESAAAAEELSSQANLMKKLVSKFKVAE